MAKAEYKNIEVDSFHEAICAALFDRYDWNWEKPRKGLKGWFPDFRLKGETHIYIECKGNVKWTMYALCRCQNMRMQYADIRTKFSSFQKLLDEKKMHGDI